MITSSCSFNVTVSDGRKVNGVRGSGLPAAAVSRTAQDACAGRQPCPGAASKAAVRKDTRGGDLSNCLVSRWREANARPGFWAGWCRFLHKQMRGVLQETPSTAAISGSPHWANARCGEAGFSPACAPAVRCPSVS